MKIDFRQKKISLLTKHGKECIIAPVLERRLNCNIELIQSVDTDELGTFDRTVQRQGTQRQTVRRKAHMGIDASSNTMGVASEGSFVPDPFSGFMPWNIEMVMLVDDLSGLEVTGIAQGSAMSMSGFFRDVDGLLQFAQDAGFPSHHLMLRPESQTDKRVYKGISDASALIDTFIDALSQSRNGKVFVENDLRAHCNPTRQKMIEQATEDLAQKLLSSCPQCQSPGFWKSTFELGLPCRSCGSPTNEPTCEIWRCERCEHETHHHLKEKQVAEPDKCHMCNP